MITTANCGLSLQATGKSRINTHIIKVKVQCSEFKGNCSKIQIIKFKDQSSKVKENWIYKLFLLGSKLIHALLASKRRLIGLQ